MATITETFTHADSAGSLTADRIWSIYSGTAWGIVSNAAKISGAVGSTARMEVDADLSQLVTVQATLTSYVAAAAGKFSQVGIMLQKDSSSTDTRYVWYAVSATFPDYELWKAVNGSYTLLGSASLTPANGDVLKLTWNPSTHALTGYVNGVSKVSVVDSAITGNTRAGLDASSNDPASAIVLDMVSLSQAKPTLFRPAALSGLGDGGPFYHNPLG